MESIVGESGMVESNVILIIGASVYLNTILVLASTALRELAELGDSAI